MNETWMKPMNLLAGGLISLWMSAPVWGQALSLDRIAVVVNNEAITEVEVKQRIAQARGMLSERGITAPANEVIRKQVVEQMIVERAGQQLAREMNMRVDDASVDRAIEQIARNNQLERDALLKRVAQGQGVSAFREGLRNDMLMQRLREREVDARVQVSEAEVDAVLSSLGTSADTEYSLSQILIRVPESASPEQTEKARLRMVALRQQLATGANFAQIAAANSEAPEASAGGDLGWRAAERLPTLFVREVEKLKPGQLSQLIRSAAGFHLLRMNDQRKVSAAAGPPVEQWRARHILFRV
ncbi:MAG: molecular chaperone SurA, partial [Betaproteobacteria bacterium]|nr:molecular chaperone SurA [Betaproteobacteria bacterium]